MATVSATVATATTDDTATEPEPETPAAPAQPAYDLLQLERVKKSAMNTMVDMGRALAALEEFAAAVEAAEKLHGPYPTEARTDINPYSLRYRTIDIRIAPSENRSWRGLSGTAGIVYRLRRFYGIDKLGRFTSTYDGSTEFSGRSTFAGARYYFKITCENQVPDNCTLVEETVTETVTRKSYKTVCN